MSVPRAQDQVLPRGYMGVRLRETTGREGKPVSAPRRAHPSPAFPHYSLKGLFLFIFH